eukprot:CAMPEP_0181121110 /NCGR_PEP_ID=MMETSP1071-20121207/24551_1 /TAXON_ID=35127 /ORGANISM="Thalassiosira sp., Strain NH16" /LENGTH=236 /DNA_ID=CAMNT_0023205883 /DNA_START=423 /DNA_END=1130 /DNA_ORIENTATION=-
MSELKTNAEALEATSDIQQRTKAALIRMQQQAAQSQEVGAETLTSLQQQQQQTERIKNDAKRMEYELNKTDRSLNKFDRLSGKIFGRRKRAAKKEVEAAVNAGVLKSSSSAGSNRGVVGASADNKVKSHKAVPMRPKAQAMNASAPAEMNNNRSRGLSKEERAKMMDIQKNDEEIDDMLGAMDEVLDNLNELGIQMKEEVDAQNSKMDTVAEKIDRTNKKQAVVNSRVQRSLVGKW